MIGMNFQKSKFQKVVVKNIVGLTVGRSAGRSVGLTVGRTVVGRTIIFSAHIANRRSKPRIVSARILCVISCHFINSFERSFSKAHASRPQVKF